MFWNAFFEGAFKYTFMFWNIYFEGAILKNTYVLKCIFWGRNFEKHLCSKNNLCSEMGEQFN